MAVDSLIVANTIRVANGKKNEKESGGLCAEACGL